MHLVADEGWRLLAHYRFDAASGMWEHHARTRAPAGLAELVGDSGVRRLPRAPESALTGQLQEARRILAAAGAERPEHVDVPRLSPEFERIRWFPLPAGVSS